MKLTQNEINAMNYEMNPKRSSAELRKIAQESASQLNLSLHNVEIDCLDRANQGHFYADFTIFAGEVKSEMSKAQHRLAVCLTKSGYSVEHMTRQIQGDNSLLGVRKSDFTTEYFVRICW